MFIQVKRSGYDRTGQQICSGLFLILLQPGTDSIKYPWRIDKCSDCGRPESEHKSTLPLAGLSCPEHGIMARLKARARAKAEPHDTDFLDASRIDCPACIEYERVKAEIGCQYFRSTSASYPIRALVRHVAMSQCGHFMMGFARIHSTRLTLSGSYGSDGLPDSVPDSVYDIGTDVPAELIDKWNKGGGWNGAGSEAPDMRKWALENLAALRR